MTDDRASSGFIAMDNILRTKVACFHGIRQLMKRPGCLVWLLMSVTYASAQTPAGGVRTNFIRNSTMQGAAAPSTVPNNWNILAIPSGLGIIIGSFSSAGLANIQFVLSGTPSASGTFYIQLEAGQVIPAAEGQSWTLSAYEALPSGSVAGISGIQLLVNESNSAGGFLAQDTQSIALPTSASLSGQRPAFPFFTNGGSAVAYLQPYIAVSVIGGVAVDATLQIGNPKLQPNSVSPPIPTTNAARTVAAINATSAVGAVGGPPE